MRKKKILILAYYFPPNSAISSHRPASWAVELAKNGFDVTVITRHWTGTEQNWKAYLSKTENKEIVQHEKGYKIIYLPFDPNYSNIFKFKLLNKLYHQFLFFKGIFSIETNTLQWQPFLRKYLKDHACDLLIATSPPLNIIKLAYEISKEKKIPFITDYRDFENEIILRNDKKSAIREFGVKYFFYYRLRVFYHRIISEKAVLVTSINTQILNFLIQKKQSSKLLILNGYEKETFSKLSKYSQDFSNFTISIIGSIYPQQNLHLFLQSFKKFVENREVKVNLNFIGLNAFPEVANKVKSHLPYDFVKITDRISRESALEIGKSSHVLFYPGWEGYSGVYSGKIFEYLGLQRNILIAPGDNDVIDSLIAETKAGRVEYSKEGILNTLNTWYNEWENTGELKYKGNQSLITKYSRENQAKKLRIKIKEVLESKYNSSKD